MAISDRYGRSLGMSVTSFEGAHGLSSPIEAKQFEYPLGYEGARHQHQVAQLMCSVQGVLRVKINDQLMWVPPGLGIWLPPFVPHLVEAKAYVQIYSLFIRTESFPESDLEAGVISVTPLLFELIRKSLQFPRQYQSDSPEHRIGRVLFDELSAAENRAMSLPLPKHGQLLKLYTGLQLHPGSSWSVEQWGDYIGMSSRHLSRRLKLETGMAFQQWRTQLRLLTACERLARSEPVTRIALDLGYNSASAFIYMFKQHFGFSPRCFSASNSKNINFPD